MLTHREHLLHVGERHLRLHRPHQLILLRWRHRLQRIPVHVVSRHRLVMIKELFTNHDLSSFNFKLNFIVLMQLCVRSRQEFSSKPRKDRFFDSCYSTKNNEIELKVGIFVVTHVHFFHTRHKQYVLHFLYVSLHILFARGEAHVSEGCWFISFDFPFVKCKV